VSVTTLQELRGVIRKMRAFVDEVYLPDTLAIAGFYKDWFRRGEGLGNFMTYGDFPASGLDDPSQWTVPRGVVLDRDLTKIEPVDLEDPAQIAENVAHAWYAYARGDAKGLHPYAGQTTFDYDGPKPPYDHLDVSKGYSWLKSPRWRGRPVEVGPLARLVMMLAAGNEAVREIATAALRILDLPQQAIFSTMGRTAARAIESKLAADLMEGWLDALLANIAKGDLAVG
jgi:hydrogenase large subunit